MGRIAQSSFEVIFDLRYNKEIEDEDPLIKIVRM